MNFTLKSKGRILLIQKPMVMGILNVTPDSFFEGSRINLNIIADKAGEMLQNGASILDIGGQSTRPGAEQIGALAEAERVMPAIEAVRSAFPDCWISVDTYHSFIAKRAVNAGADIVNDVSAGDDDPDMIATLAALQVPFIAMHKQGKPQTMQENPQYNSVVTDVIEYFKAKKLQLELAGIYDWVLDPGFGFGKTLEHNFSLLKNLQSLTLFNRPILVGLSRKGMIQKALNVSAGKALNGTTALHMVALSKSASILRVHDAKEALEVVKLWELTS